MQFAITLNAIALDECGQSPKLSMVEGAANYLLEQAQLDPSVPPPKVGATWTKRLVDRHPLYFKRKQKPLAAERDNAHDIESMTKYFEAYRAVQTERGTRWDSGRRHLEHG